MKLPRVVRSIASAMSGRLATAALNYGLFWYLAHTLDANALGGFSLLMSVFLMVSLLPMLGLSIPFMRRVAVSPDAIQLEVSNALAFAIPVSAVLALSIGGWGRLSRHPELTSAYWLVAATLLPSAWVLVAECTLLARERMRDVTRVNMLEALLRTALSIFLVRRGHGLDEVFAAFLGARLLSMLVYALHPVIPLPRFALWSAALQRRNWREMPVFLCITIVAALVLRLDVVVLSHMRDLREAATYAAASRLYEAAQILPSVTALVVMPVLARQHASSPESIPATLGLAVRVGLTVGLGAAVLASAFAQQVIDLLYPPEMASAASALRWLIFAAAVMMVDVILSSTMLATDAQSADLHALMVGLAVLASTLFILVPLHGPRGAAMAVTAGVSVRLVVRLRWAMRVLQLTVPWSYLGRIATACIAGVWAMWITRNHGAVIAGASGLLVYACVAMLSGAIDRPFLRELRSGMSLLVRRR